MLEANSTQNILVQHHLIVITIPMYNEVKYIADTLESVSKQTWTDFKVLISDNASTDGSGEICEAFCKKDDRFHYIRQPVNIGACKNFQFLLDHTESPYFMWLGAHDLLHPHFLETHLKVMTADKDITLSYSNTQFIDEYGQFQSITNGGKLADIKGTPYVRYLQSILNLGEYTPINQVIRRDALQNFACQLTYGSDNMPLSRLIYLGKIHRHPEALYIARYWFHSSRDTTEMERSTGDQSAGIDFRKFRRAYLEDFDKLIFSRKYKWALRIGVMIFLEFRIVWHKYHYNKELPLISYFIGLMKRAFRKLGMLRLV